MFSTVIAAVGLFAGTNIDDIIVVTLFFLAVQRGTLRTWHVIAGQFTGVGALIVISLVAALGLTLIPDKYVGLLGLIPLALGVWGFVKFFRALRAREQSDEPAISPGGLLGVIGVTLANGADNISVYTPLFRTMSTADTVITVIVFVILIGVWLIIGRLIGTRKTIVRFVARVEGWLVPLVFTGLGVLIVAESGVIEQLLA